MSEMGTPQTMDATLTSASNSASGAESSTFKSRKD